MIQSAVAFHHLQIGRPGAARRMYQIAKEKFARLGMSVFMSLDLDDYQAQLDTALSWLLAAADPREVPMPEITRSIHSRRRTSLPKWQALSRLAPGGWSEKKTSAPWSRTPREPGAPPMRRSNEMRPSDAPPVLEAGIA